MDTIKNALTRKFGPLPAWAWLTIFAVGLYWYRNRSSAAASGTGTGSVAPTPATPQPDTTLQPGESVYDPNTGTLSTAPGGTSSDPSSSIDSDGLSTAIANALAADLGGGGGGTNTGTTPGGDTGSTSGGNASSPNVPPSKIKPVKPGTALGNGKIEAPSGPRKPAARPGYKTVGVGNGRWIYVPTRKKTVPKTKAGQNRNEPVVSGKGVKRSRSSTAIRSLTGGRSAKKPKVTAKVAAVIPRTRNTTAVTRPSNRRRGTLSAIRRGSPTQHAVATHPKVTPKPAPRPAPRPSAPATRVTRTQVAKPKPKPAPKKRG